MFNVLFSLWNKKPNQQEQMTQNKYSLIEYIVQSGDTLFGLSLQFNCSVWRIRQLNSMKEQDIYPGKSLQIEILDEDDDDAEEQKTISQEVSFADFKRLKLLNTNLVLQMAHQTPNGLISGSLRVTFEQLRFVPDRKKLIKFILETTNKKEQEINDELLQRYEFTIYQREIHKFEYYPTTQKMAFYIWGVIGIPAPMFYDETLNVIEIELYSEMKETPKQLIDYFHIKKPELPFVMAMEILAFILYMIQADHEKLVEDSLNRFLVLPIQEKEKPHIGCESIIRYYQLVPLEQSKDQPDNKKQNLQVLPKMRPNVSKIINKKIFEEIYQNLPQYLQNKDWYLMYSPTIHALGTSYEELMRRTECIGPHIFILKDERSTIFGAYVSESWKLSKNMFYGTGESFLFTFKFNKQIKVFKSTQKNQDFQMADQTGISVGAGDRYGLYINSDLMNGSSHPCDSFDNVSLSFRIDFRILELEFWGLDEECANILNMLTIKKSLFTN